MEAPRGIRKTWKLLTRENGTDVVAGGSDHLKKLIEHHKEKHYHRNNQRIYSLVSASYMGPLSVQGLVATDGTCDPFVKVSYVPPGDIN